MSLYERIRQQERDRPPPVARAALAARLGYTSVKVEGQVQAPVSRLGRRVVGESSDLERILALPERGTVEVSDLSWLRKPAGPCRCAAMGRPCCRELLPIQAQALSEAARVGGLLASIGVGHGKELIFQLLPMVVPGVRTAVLLIGPEMRESFKLDWDYYGQHWEQPNLVLEDWLAPLRWELRVGRPRLKVIAYSELSHEKFTAALRSWDPDLIMGNEAHNLCRLSSVRTRRVLSFCAEKPSCRTAWGSGTLTVRSIRDAAHLSGLALGAGSPYPLDGEVLDQWAAAVDPEQHLRGKLPALMGAMSQLCRVGETAREAFRRRRLSTPGVVETSEASIPNALNIHRREPPPIPGAVQQAMDFVRRTATRPDWMNPNAPKWMVEQQAGEEFAEQWEVQRCLHQLAAGFYYFWAYPRGESPELIDRWFAARQAWNREVRQLLLHPLPYLDSPKLAARAALRYEEGRVGTPEKPVWPSGTFAEWREVHKLVRPEKRVRWVSDWLAQDAAEWVRSLPRGRGGIIWYSSTAFGQKVEELSGLRRYGGGPRANEEILREDGTRSIIASIKAYNKNFNLQAFSRNLVTQSPPDAAMWEQLLGRTHRRGQAADEVDVWLYLHSPEIRASFKRSLEELATFVQETGTNPQKLLYANYTWDRSAL